MVQSHTHSLLSPRVHNDMPPVMRANRSADLAVNALPYLALISELQNKVTSLQEERQALAGAMKSLEQNVQRAARLQRDLLERMPDAPGAELSLLYQPLEGVSGDAYHVANLSETSIGIGMIDASDHGMSAAILTSNLLTSLRSATDMLAAGHLADSRSVLESVQAQLMALNLPGCEFAAGLHAVYDSETRVLRFSRAGTPYPIHIHADGKVEALVCNGPILGALEDATFDSISVDLKPGDTVVFATDGLEALLASIEPNRQHTTTILSDWFASRNHLPVSDQIQELRQHLKQTRPQNWQADDVTAIFLHITR
ncbi:MAG: serine/threonine-protein phosphatase [Planctomycetes bacterium]|nr:serine/threonine-protein phosphatase [Planctomycetota bacterium]